MKDGLEILRPWAIGLPISENCADTMIICLGMLPACDGQTDGPTDGAIYVLVATKIEWRMR